MEFFDLIQQRYSVRRYQARPVEDEKLQQVLEAARMAPTAANRQPFRLLVVKTEGRQSELSRIYGREWFTQAPLVICACALPSEGWTRGDGKNFSEVDTTIAMDHLILAAAALGLGTCWIAAFDPVSAKEIFNLPEDVEPLALTPLGYPADEPNSKLRKDLSDIVRYEKW